MNSITGQKIVEVKRIPDSYLDDFDWSCGGVMLVLENGMEIFAACDEEMNNTGHLVVCAHGDVYSVRPTS
jgi:hypothetical protein